MKKSRILSVFVVLSLILPTSLPAVSHGTTFSDIRGHWAESFINQAVSRGIIQGYPDGTFRPDNPVTRAEFTSMMNRTLGNTGTAGISFSDVRPGSWYHQDIARGVAASYIIGRPDGTFRPDASITREETAVIISRIVPAQGPTGNLSVFSDSWTISSWAVDAFRKANGRGYLGPYQDGRLHPAAQLTRGQAAKIITDIQNNERIVTTDPVVRSNNTTLSNTIYSNNVTIHQDLGSGNATIENSVILGNLNINGGGSSSVTISNSRVSSAHMERNTSSVNVVLRGETLIARMTAARTGTIQTTNLTGSGNGIASLVTTGSSRITLRGFFPSVTVNGANSQLNLESGSISNLNVSSSGRNSEITVNSNASIDTVNVSAESAFKGTGNIRTMNIFANNVTYERRPQSVNVGSGVNNPQEDDGDVTFRPGNGETNVRRNTTITITFATAMRLFDGGGTITGSDIEDLVELREGSSSGDHVDFSGRISSNARVITITPADELERDTTYHVILRRNTFRDSDRNGNIAYNVAFSTGRSVNNDDGDEDIIFDPEHEETGVSRGIEPTIEFPMAVITYDGQTVTRDYLQEAVTLRNETTNRRVSFTAAINYARDTITITPRNDLVDDNEYSLTIESRKFRYRTSNEEVRSTSATWMVGVFQPPTVTNISFSSVGTDRMTVAARPNYTGTVHVLLLPGTPADISAPSVQTVKTDPRSQRASVSKGSSRSFTFTGLAAGTDYTAFFVLNAKGRDTAPPLPSGSQRTSTAPLVPTSNVNFALTTPTAGGGNAITINQTPNPKTVAVNVVNNTDPVVITGTFAAGQTVAVSGTDSENVTSAGTSTAPTFEVDTSSIAANGGSMTFNITVSETGRSDIVYRVTVTVAAPLSPTSDVTFVLTTPVGGSNAIATNQNPSPKTINVSATSGTNSVVITGTFAAGQTAAVSGTGSGHVTSAGTPTAPTFTMNTSGIATAGGSITFDITVRETGRSDIVYRVTVTVAAPPPLPIVTAKLTETSGGGTVSSPVSVSNLGETLNYTLALDGLRPGYDVNYSITKTDANNILTLPATTTGVLTSTASSSAIVFQVASNNLGQPARNATFTISFTGTGYQPIPNKIVQINLGAIVNLSPESAGVAGESTITGLSDNHYYKVTTGAGVSFVTSTGALSSDLAHIGFPSGGAITSGLTNGSTYEYTVTTAAAFSISPLTYWDHSGTGGVPGTTSSAIVSNGAIILPASSGGISYGINVAGFTDPSGILSSSATFELMRISNISGATWPVSRSSGTYDHEAHKSTDPPGHPDKPVYAGVIENKNVGLFRYDTGGEPGWINGMSIIYVPITSTNSTTDFIFRNKTNDALPLTVLRVYIGDDSGITGAQAFVTFTATGADMMQTNDAISPANPALSPSVSRTAGEVNFQVRTPSSAVISASGRTVTVNAVNNTNSVTIAGAFARGQSAGITAGFVRRGSTGTQTTFEVDTKDIAQTGGTKTFTITVRESGQSDIVYTVNVNVMAPQASGGPFTLIQPGPGTINTSGNTVTVNVARDTRIAVIQGPLTSGQRAATNATGVTANSSGSTFTMTVDTRSLANGGRIEFPVTISESGKANIVYTVRINTL